MKRKLSALLALGLIAGTLASSAHAAGRKLVPTDKTYHIVWTGGACALSTKLAYAADEGCADPFAGITGDQLGTGPFNMPAMDGVPLILDSSKAIKGKLTVDSWYLAGYDYDVMGVGAATVEVKLTGTIGTEEVVIGELTTDPYVVTPAQQRYTVEFEIQPPEELSGKTLKGLTLSLEATGAQMFHGVFAADGTSTLTVGAFTKK